MPLTRWLCMDHWAVGRIALQIQIVLVASVCKLEVIAQNKKPVMRVRAWRMLQLCLVPT